MFVKKILGAAAVVVIAFSSFASQAAEITVGGKNFTEQLLLAEMTTRLLNGNGIAAEKVDGMGTSVLRKAMENDQIQVCWEYTGTSLVTLNKVKERMGAEATYNKVKELDGAKDIVWLNASKANNTYALAVRKSDNQGLNTLSDLAAKYSKGEEVKLGVNAEWPKRKDGLIGLQKAYDFKVARSNLVPMQSGLIYTALKEGDVDVGLVFATDGRISAFGFQILKDDKGFFPNYALAPTIRKETLEANPKIGELLNALSAKLDDVIMQNLNAQVDVEKKTIETVSEEFLKAQGLI
jgi:osmoprotectant transport system substrate-binding protein